MAESGPASGPQKPPPKPDGNPAFRMMGLPRLSRLKLPSRNWLIFLSVTGTWTSALLYDRYWKKRIQKKWCHLVSHLADETLPGNMMPRKITVFLEAPPGDNLRPAREHFHEYVKPILVAGALDWEVLEGRKEGEVRAELAQKIRKIRLRNGESTSENGEKIEADEDLVLDTRKRAGTSEWGGVQGDLIIGRHTWKEYVRGLHEGWLGPFNAPESPSDSPQPKIENLQSEDTESSEASAQTQEKEAEDPPKKAPFPPPPYIATTSYSTTPTTSILPDTFAPSTLIPLPYLLGFKHTPTRIHRFLTRRRLADSTGAQVAALVLAAQDRPYEHAVSFTSAADPDEASPSLIAPEGSVVQSGQAWEQVQILQEEESGWHKSAFAPLKDGEEQRERVWTDDIVVDDRIGSRMRTFVLEDGAEAKAQTMEEEQKKQEPSIADKVRTWIGWQQSERHGWEMGEQGDESS